MSLELKKIVGDDRESRVEIQHSIQQEIKQEMKQAESTPFALASTPRPMKRGSVDEHNFDMMDMASPSSPAKRRKSVPSSLQSPMKLERSVFDFENASGQSAYWPPST